MKGLSALALLFAVDAVWGLAQGHNMYTLKSGGGGAIAANVVTLVVCLVLGPAFWRAARARAVSAAWSAYQAHEAGLISQEERDEEAGRALRDFR